MNGPGRFPLRVGHYAVVGAAVHPCEAPYSPRVRLRSTEADDDPSLTTREVDRDEVTRVFRVTTTAVWHDAAVEVQALRVAGAVVQGQAGSRPKGVAVRSELSYASKPVQIPEGAEMWRVRPDGTTELAAVYRGRTWHTIIEQPLDSVTP